MKILINIVVGLCFSSFVLAQSDPTVSTLMQYEESPVDLSIGLQDISVPFVNLPTRNKEITCDISLKYHPLNSIYGNEVSSNCGIGWNLFAGGVISRTIIGTNDANAFYSQNSSSFIPDDIYQFNFMGYFGRFIINKNSDGSLGVKVIKQKESKLILKIEKDNHYEVTKFTFFDEKGYRYIFDIINNNNFHNSAYYLSSILDNNNQELLHINYQTISVPETFNASGAVSGYIVNQIKEIYSPGYGKITFEYLNSGINAKISNILLNDLKGNCIKKMILFGTQSRIYKIQLTNLLETLKEDYQFYYSNNSNLYGDATDLFGYKTNPPQCFYNNKYGIPSPSVNTLGLLIKMKLPTGGSIIYDYESNTYSKYVKGQDNIWHYDTDANSYYDFLNTNPTIPLIPENFIMTDYGNGTNSYPFNFTNTATTFDFTVTGSSAKTLFFNIYAEGYVLPPLPHDTIGTFRNRTPVFTLKRIPSNYTIPHFNEMGYYKDTKSGLCFNQMIDLDPGTYRITISSDHNLYNFGTLEIKSQEPNPNPTKWYYGGGIRLKQIGFFDNDAPFNFYDPFYNSNYISQGYKPVKEKKYNYNFFGTSTSSGYLAESDFSTINQDDNLYGYVKMYFGGYKNVTVTDTQNNGREEYTFKDGLDPVDFDAVDIGLTYENSKSGLLLKKESFDSNGNLITSTSYNYDINDPETDGGISASYPYSPLPNSYPSVFTPNPSTPAVTSNLLEIGKLTQKTTTEYFSNSQSKTVTEYFSYDATNYQLIEHSTKNSLGENLKTEYYYDINNSPYSQNRIWEPLQTKFYRSGGLIATNKITYSNMLGSAAYLPQTIEYARGNGSLEVKNRFNAYDIYGNLIEEQRENGKSVTYIWGYNYSMIVAKLENISLFYIPSNLITAIQTATDSLTATEADVLNALNALRTSSSPDLQKAMITTYTYKPLIGVSTVTDPKGSKTSYEYDELGRLIRVRDQFNNILSEAKYYLFNQN